MKFGMMCQLQMPRPWGEGAERLAYANFLAQAEAAEHAGFDHIWLTEQHFCAEIGHSACPEMLLAALSQRTSRVRLGFAVIILPAHNPFMVAERVATLDVLSLGRAEFGCGRGAYPYIVEGLGLDPAAGRELGRETLEAVLKMYEYEFFPGYKGKYLDLAARHVIPRPLQRPHPPLWVAASSLETWAHAGRQGVGVLGIAHTTPAETKPAIDAYRAAIRAKDRAERVSTVDNEHAAAFAVGVCLDDDREGRAVGCAAARWYFGQNDAELNHVRFASGSALHQVAEKFARRTDDELVEDARAIGGNPDTVSRQVEKWQAAGLDQIMFMLQSGRTTHDQVMRSIRLIGDKVIRRFAA
ncbi:MAG: LLM class flavin-dependent oxidoreductase [Alphaproteobacteria bacterium]